MAEQICQEKLKKKFVFYEKFRGKKGPYPILFTDPHLAKSKNYIKYNLVEHHNDVNKPVLDNLLGAESYPEFTDDVTPILLPVPETTLFPTGLNLTTNKKLHLANLLHKLTGRIF